MSFLKENAGDMLLGSLRAGVLLAGFIGGALVVMPLQWLCLKLNRAWAKKIPFLYHRYLHRLLGIKVRVEGVPYRDGPCLVVANHTSWLDIPVLGGLSAVSFIAKKEVGAWPFFGTLARLQETVFVDRERRTKTAQQRNEIFERLKDGDTLVLFPEGTSSDGNRVLPFKSALMGVAELAMVSAGGDETHDVVVQPVSVAYTKLCGMPMGRKMRPFYAWYGDMDLFPHLWEAFSLGSIEVVVACHAPVTVSRVGDRKKLARYCGTRSHDGVSRALTGREPVVVSPPVVSSGIQSLAAE